MNKKEQLYQLKIGKEIDEIYRKERNKLPVLKEMHAKNGTLNEGMFAK